MSGIGTINDVIANLPLIFLKEGQFLWNYLAKHVAMSRKKLGKGASVQWTVSNGGVVTFNRPAGYTVVPASDVDNTDRVKMTLNRGIYSSSFGFTDDELAQVQSYVGTDDIADVVRDLWAEAYTERLAGITRQLEIDSLIGTGSTPGWNNGAAGANVPNIQGFVNILASSGSYAGQTFSPTVNPGLSSTVMNIGTLSSGNVSRAQIRQMFAYIKQATGFNPDYMECSPLTATFVNGIGDNQIRYFNVSDREIFNTSAQNVQADDSVTSVLGIPLVENTAWGLSSASSPAASADGYILFGARDKTFYDILPYDDAQDALLSQILELTSKADNGVAMKVGIPVRTWAQAKTAASKILNMDVSVQMEVLAPNRFGLMTGVTGFTANT